MNFPVTTKRLLFVSFAAVATACGAAAPSDENAESNPVATDDQNLTAGGLTRAETRTVLKLIDDICGDTWCEGDYNFRFQKIACSARSGSCALTFQMIPYDDGQPSSSACSRTCVTDEFSGFDSLVETNASGYQSLQPAYYDALSTCISRLEDERR